VALEKADAKRQVRRSKQGKRRVRLQTWCGGRPRKGTGTRSHPPAWGGIEL